MNGSTFPTVTVAVKWVAPSIAVTVLPPEFATADRLVNGLTTIAFDQAQREP
jgi:hypothetical protein